MDFSPPLIPARFLKRYKRFFADLELEGGREITAHCPNPGAMLGLLEPGAPCWVSRSDDPKRRLAYTLQLMRAGGDLVGINTVLPNRIVAEALEAKAISALSGYSRIRREVPYATASRVDFLLEDDKGTQLYLEIKNVHLKRRAGLAEFPDCVTARGARHMADLGAMVLRHTRAMVLFLVQRENCNHVAISGDLDPAYATAFAKALKAGVEVLAYDCLLSPDGISLNRPLPVVV